MDRKLLPYLTPLAIKLWQNFVKQGMDEDLALQVLELQLDEDELYELPPKDDDND